MVPILNRVKGFASIYNFESLNVIKPELQLKDTESATKTKLKGSLTQLKGYKFVATLVIVFQKTESEEKKICDTFYANSKAGTDINESDTHHVFKSFYTSITSNIQKSLGKGSSRIIDSVIDHNSRILRYNTLAGSSYIKLAKDLDHPRKGLINNIQNIDDNECCKWCLVRYLNPADRHPARIKKASKNFSKMFDFKDIEFYQHLYFWLCNKRKHPIYVS